METLTARDVDELLAECVEELPGWVLDRLGDTRDPRRADAALVAVRPARRTGSRSTARGCWRMRRRGRSCGAATRAELLRLVVERLELEGAQAVELAAVCL